MHPTLLLAPAAAGKTRACIERIRAVLVQEPLARAWVVLPDRNQAAAFSRRLALEGGGALGVRISTFEDLYTELLILARKPVPLAPEQLVRRLTRAAVDSVLAKGELRHYGPIARRPGFTQAAGELIAELKRALVTPEQFARAVEDLGAPLRELAEVYAAYQERLIALGWADGEGLGWLAVDALERDPSLAADWRLLIADGFDSFNPVTLRALALLSGRMAETLVTLTGMKEIDRPVYSRFRRTLEQVEQDLAPEVETLPPRENGCPPLAYLERNLFRPAQKQEAGTNITWLEAQTIRLEAREALRWLKARIVRDGVPPDECAVLARDLDTYRAFLREAASEFGLPIRFLGGEPLARNPAVAAILGLLGLARDHWRRRPLLDAIRSPYFDFTRFGLTRADAARLDKVARQGQVIEGEEQWRTVLKDLALKQDSTGGTRDERDEETAPSLPTGKRARALWQGLYALMVRATPPERAVLPGHVEWVQELLFGANGLGVLQRSQEQPDTRARDLAALAALGETLRSLLLSETIAGGREPATFPEFLEELEGILEVTIYIPDDPVTRREARIYAGNLNTTRGIAYRAVALLGLSEGLFPAPLSEDPFLSDEEREHLRRAGLKLEPRLRSDQQTRFYEAVTRASEYLLLTRPYLSEDGEWWQPSPYWEAALALFDARPLTVRPDAVRPIADAASPLELATGAMRAGPSSTEYGEFAPQLETLNGAAEVLAARLAREAAGRFEGDCEPLQAGLMDRFGSGHNWSASRLEKYGTCPFYFWLSAALDLELREPPEAGYDAAQLGLVLHAILEQVYQRAANPARLDDVLAVLPQVANEVFDAAPAAYGFRPTPLWTVQRAELLEALIKTITNLNEEAAGFRPVCFEQHFGGDRPLQLNVDGIEVRLHGVIDRVDRDEDGQVRVIDYKTGSGGFAQSELSEGRRLQLPLYALAAEKALRLGQVVDGFYWAILKGEKSSLRLGSFHDDLDEAEFHGPDGAMRLAQAWTGKHIRRIRAGHFPPSPTSDNCPSYCPGKLSCWRYNPSERA